MSLPPERARALQISTAAVAGALVMIAFYSLDRTHAAITNPAPDPALVIASTRIEYFWRVAVCAWIAPLSAAGAYFAARGREQRAWAWTQRAILPTVIIACILAAVFP